MKDRSLRISEKKAQEVIQLATKLYARHSEEISVSELIEAGESAEIPSNFIEEALKQIYAKESGPSKYINRLSLLGLVIILSSGLAFFIGYQKAQRDQDIAYFNQASVASSQTVTVREGRLNYIANENLNIGVEDIIGSSAYVNIGSDGYRNLEIEGGNVGDVYEYRGARNYRIRIIEVKYSFDDSSVTFKVDQFSNR